MIRNPALAGRLNYATVYLNRTDPGSKMVDFFRFENGKIVEHWDVIQPPTPASGPPSPPG